MASINSSCLGLVGSVSDWFFKHEQHLAVAVGVKRGECRAGKEYLASIRTAVGAGLGLRFVQNH